MNFQLGIFLVFFWKPLFRWLCFFYGCWQVIEEPYSRVVYTLLRQILKRHTHTHTHTSSTAPVAPQLWHDTTPSFTVPCSWECQAASQKVARLRHLYPCSDASDIEAPHTHTHTQTLCSISRAATVTTVHRRSGSFFRKRYLAALLSPSGAAVAATFPTPTAFSNVMDV